ncbi:MAG: SNF2-related protein [Chloroflexota bacterium]|nr:SNF2-related protein [Chloroflexota bacterium]
MPTYAEFLAAGRGDLYKAIRKYHGGLTTVAQYLGLTVFAKKSKGYWEDFVNVEKELQQFIVEHGTPGGMPTRGEFENANRSALAAAIVAHHGGLSAVGTRLGLSTERQRRHGPKGWDDFAILERELRAFVKDKGTEGMMPTLAQLKVHARHDLVSAINKHHGVEVVSKRLGWSLSYEKRRNGYWADFANVERELKAFVQARGTPGVMPTNNDLRSADRSDLVKAVLDHGGFPSVAERIGWTANRKPYERLNPGTAADAARIARAIQPLAESNLLSPGQVMVILRRAGLLDNRSRRLIRLSASLARGCHDEIEGTLSGVMARLDNNDNVDVPGDEDEEIDIAQIEHVRAVGLDGEPVTGFGQTLLSASRPHLERERAVIGGLSALGALRLPLDAVLGLLTSRLLWEAFFRRLYVWYGSLDATQQVTADDVEAAILGTYPHHTDNDFVAEASHRFAQEVQHAVNFAVSVRDLGWQGPRLRLHQADAARRMAEVLAGCDAQQPFLLNADDPGMGKSAAFLAAVAAAGIQQVVLVAPKTVADDTWAAPHGEIARCLPLARVVRGLDQALNDLLPDTLTFTVLHYEELLDEDRLAKMTGHPIDCLCLDEVHLVKQRAGQNLTQRRSALDSLRAGARAAIGLTGTPLVNELAEPMSLLQVLSGHDPQFDHARLSNRRMSDVADVFEALLPHVIRRRKRETLLHLPGCDVRPVPIPLPEDVEAAMLEVYEWPRSRAAEALVELRKLATKAKLSSLLRRGQAADKLLILTYLADDVSERVSGKA